MAICLILYKMIKVKLAINRLKREKVNAYRKSINLPPKYGCCEQLFRWIFGGLKNLFLYLFCWCLVCKFGKEKRSKWDMLWTDGTLANSILKSFVGFLFGLCFTHFLTLFLIFQLNFDPVKTTYSCMFLGLLLTFGLAFSQATRCFVFLSFPQFFTKKGRAAILAYCFILALSGPGKNTTANMEILTESLICGQEMAKNATQGLIDLIKSPLSALGAPFMRMKDAIVEAAMHVKNGIGALVRAIVAVGNVIKAALKWLKKITSICNKKLGTPFERCIGVFEEAISDCKVKMGAMDWMCNVVSVVQYLCYVAKIVDLLCWLPNLIKEAVIYPIQMALENVKDQIKTFFDVRFNFTDFYKLKHSFNSSKTFREVVHGMKSEIMEQVHWFVQYMDWVNLLVSMFMFLALYKALVYRFRFMKSERHDNFYITKYLVRLDLTRRRLGKETVFPLKYRESFVYIQTFSFVLLEAEKKALMIQLAIVAYAAVKICTIILIDYCFYRFLLLVKMHGAIHFDTRAFLGFNVKVRGEGFMADMYRAILFALSPIGDVLPVFDTTPCLPIPIPPNYYEYAMIIFLLTVCFIACVTEPYGMRLRHIICEMYYPDRKLPRARWLYQHILSARGNFLMYARSQLKAKKGEEGETFKVGILDRLSHTVPCFRWVLYFFGVRKKKCFLCGKSGEMDNMEDFVHCPGCDSVFCNDCYEEIEFRCVACMSPIEFGDISDESGSHSSDEDSDDNSDVEANAKKPLLSLMSSDDRKLITSKPKTRDSSASDTDDEGSDANLLNSDAEMESQSDAIETENDEDKDASDADISEATLIDLDSDNDVQPPGTRRVSRVRFSDPLIKLSASASYGGVTTEPDGYDDYDNDDSGDRADESENGETETDAADTDVVVSGSENSTVASDDRLNTSEFEGTVDSKAGQSHSGDQELSEEYGSESSDSEKSSEAVLQPSSANKSTWFGKLKGLFAGKSTTPTAEYQKKRRHKSKDHASDEVATEATDEGTDQSASENESESEDDFRSTASLLQSSGDRSEIASSGRHRGMKTSTRRSTHARSSTRKFQTKRKLKRRRANKSNTDDDDDDGGRARDDDETDGSEFESSRVSSRGRGNGGSSKLNRTRRRVVDPGRETSTDADSNSADYETEDADGTSTSNAGDQLFDDDNLDDPDGTCHHHQGVDEDVYEKYSDVISEFTETLDGNSEENSDDDGEEDEEQQEVRRIDPHTCTRSCRQCRPSIDLEEEDEDNHASRVEKWADAAAVSTSRRNSRNLHPCISETVDQLDSYYTGMPYPPHTNVYKSKSGQY